jgi:hypothetical protein
MMFGCIPVMLNSSHHVWAVPHSLPLEEVIPWHEVGWQEEDGETGGERGPLGGEV